MLIRFRPHLDFIICQPLGNDRAKYTESTTGAALRMAWAELLQYIQRKIEVGRLKGKDARRKIK